MDNRSVSVWCAVFHSLPLANFIHRSAWLLRLGAWVEVGWPAFERYLQLYEADGTHEPVIHGALANQLPCYGDTLGLPVQVQFQSSTSRPTISFPEEAAHPLAVEARGGMSYARFHEVLLTRGNA